MTMDPQGTHSPSCSVFCVCEAASDRGAACARHHACWCGEGALTFRQFRKLHPKWDGLPAEKWLATADGRAWHRDMQRRCHGGHEHQVALDDRGKLQGTLAP